MTRVLSVLTLALAALQTATAQDTMRPNIILCMADDQGWGEMAYNGHPNLHTPNFDAMAAAGMRFDRFYAAAPVCSPTRASVLTGRHPNRSGCFSWGHNLRPQEITIAEALKPLGYVTGHFGKWHLGSVLEGSPVNPGAAGFDTWLSAYNFFDNDPLLSREGKAVQLHGESSMVTVEAALDFIRRVARNDAPFLVVIWFGSPHRPHDPLPEDLARYEHLDAQKAALLAEVTAMDRAFGKLRDALRTLNIHENTLLWYTSDNGGLPESGATGGRAEKGSIYDGGLRVPALLEWPARVAKPMVSSTPATTSDILPTLLDVTGATLGDDRPLDGESLLPLFNVPDAQRERPIGFWSYPAPGIRTPNAEWMAELLAEQNAGSPPQVRARLRLDAAHIGTQYASAGKEGHAAWLDWPWKLHRIQKARTDDPAFELYHLANDPFEERNVAAGEAERVTAMRPPLEAWQESVLDSLRGHDYP